MADITLKVPGALVAEVAAALYPDGKPIDQATVAGGNPAPMGDLQAIKHFLRTIVRTRVAEVRYRSALGVEAAKVEATYRAAMDAVTQVAKAAAASGDIDGIG